MKQIGNVRRRNDSFLVGLNLLTIVFAVGCAPTTLFFAEGTKVGFHAEFKPDASQPLSSHLGFKRRIVAVVPPQNPPVCGDWRCSGKQELPTGEALSMLSVFSVNADPTSSFDIENHFLSGEAADIATSSEISTAPEASTGREAKPVSRAQTTVDALLQP